MNRTDFAKTEIVRLFQLFEAAQAQAWSTDAQSEYLDNVSGKRLRGAWDKCTKARDAFLAALRQLMQEKADDPP